MKAAFQNGITHYRKDQNKNNILIVTQKIGECYELFKIDVIISMQYRDYDHIP